MNTNIIGGIFAVAATTMTAHATIVYSGPINQSITPGGTPYTMSITEGASTYQWSIGWEVGGPLSYSYFTPLTNFAAVSVNAVDAMAAKAYGYEESIGLGASWNAFPTLGTANGNLKLHDYINGSGNFTAFGANQYAAFCFGDLRASSAVYFGWVSFTMGKGGFTINDYAYNNGDIGAGVIPAPGAIALLGMVGFVGGRRRRN